jgi:NAD(P)-dependent dehydrogenase (short-subunit alcohol dehydrogenase family)
LVVTEVLALQLARLGAPIGVSVLCPAWVNTRILDDERNRPDRLRVDAPTLPRARHDELAGSMASTGLDPAVVADDVVEAVLTNRFYVLPNTEWTPAIGERAARIMAGGPIAPPRHRNPDRIAWRRRWP